MANNSQFTGIQPHRPPMGGPMGPPQGALPSMQMQFRPPFPPQQAQPYVPLGSQPFQPVGPTNVRVPSHSQQLHFPQPVLQPPSRPSQIGYVPPPPQPILVPDVHPSQGIASVSPQPQHNAQIPNNFMPGVGGPRLPFSSSYNPTVPSGSQQQMNADVTNHYQPITHASAPTFPAGGQPWMASGIQSAKSVTPMLPTGEQISGTASISPAAQPNPIEKAPSLWIVHATREGKRYYYNRKTQLSSWEKPLELMTVIERADASTDWREYTGPEGRKYYYNKVTKQSKWLIPDELKMAREQANMEFSKGTYTEKNVDSHTPAAVSIPEVKTSTPNADSTSSFAQGVVSSPIFVAPVAAALNLQPVETSESSPLPIEVSSVATYSVEVHTAVESAPAVSTVSGSSGTSATSINAITTPRCDSDSVSAQDVELSVNGVPSEDVEDYKNGPDSAGKASITAVEGRSVEQEPLAYENKMEAKNAFRALLETAKIGADWSWDQAMRVIINDRRYGALKTLAERKQAFNEFVGQKKQQEADERRARLKKAREDFKNMLEECQELTSTTRWSKAISFFEDDERFKAVERAKDREDLYEDHMVELEKKERAKALEQHKRNRAEYIEFLKSCDFIKASSQWRKVQDRLEADERCLRLEKFDRLEIFQEYIRDLEKEEEEQRKLQMEELRKMERRNRDDFRKLMEEHIASGTLTVNTHWRDYGMKVKDLPAYLAVSSNTSGSTAKDLFEDVLEELEKLYTEDKARIKDAVKLKKLALSSTWTFEDFKTAIIADVGTPSVSETNLKLVFDELQERAREKEEKEARRRKRLADDFYELLCTSKEITESSSWEDSKPLFEDQIERWVSEEELFKEIFDKYITALKDKAKEDRRKRENKARKDKERKDREKQKLKQRRDEDRDIDDKRRERHKKDGSDSDVDRIESYSLEDNKRSRGEKDKKHRKRHHSSIDEMSLDEAVKDWSMSSQKDSIDRNKSKRLEQHASISETDRESRYKRHKRDHRNDSHRNGDYDDLKDGEIDEDGEVR